MNKKFVEELEKFSNLTTTDNGAKGLKSTGSVLSDITWLISSRKVLEMTILANQLDLDTLLKWLFWLRSPRGGHGERSSFKLLMFTTFLRVAEQGEEALGKMNKVLKHIPKHGRWDDLVHIVHALDELDSLLFKTTVDEAITLIKGQIATDIIAFETEMPVSLIAKWLPSENTSSKYTRKIATWLRNKLKIDPRLYRKTLSKLRKAMDIVEAKMCSGNWNEIKYEAVPSKANLIYKTAFYNHDPERRKDYLERVRKGEAKINASVAFPHDIAYKYQNSYHEESDDTLEAMWKALPEYFVSNTLVVRDGSGSMCCSIPNSDCSALSVADGLSIYTAEHNKGPLKDKCITFSKTPKFIDLSSQATLYAKIQHLHQEDEVANTNLKAVFDLILNIAKKQNLCMEDLPAQIVIVSDMHFDEGLENWDETLMDSIARKYTEAGYKLPKIVYWNVAGSTTPIPQAKNDMGLVYCSGYSLHNFNMITSGEVDPEKAILAEIEKYACVLT
jgi:hypothetical protein